MLRGVVRHHIDRVGRHDDHAVRRVHDDLRDDVAEDGGVASEQFHARLARLLVDARRHDDDAAAGERVVIARVDLHRVGEGDGVEDVVRFGFGALGVLIHHDDLAPDAAHHQRIRRRRADESRADDANFHYASSQSSSFNPLIRLNSRVLCVMRIKLLASAIAAIIKSFGPIGVPREVSSARISL